ncbi:MAG: hypothetical protein AB7G47_15495 [Mycolicibacterium sp.]
MTAPSWGANPYGVEVPDFDPLEWFDADTDLSDITVVADDDDLWEEWDD